MSKSEITKVKHKLLDIAMSLCHLHHIFRHHQVDHQESVMNINRSPGGRIAGQSAGTGSYQAARSSRSGVPSKSFSAFSHEQLHFCEGPPRPSRAP